MKNTNNLKTNFEFKGKNHVWDYINVSANDKFQKMRLWNNVFRVTPIDPFRG